MTTLPYVRGMHESVAGDIQLIYNVQHPTIVSRRPAPPPPTVTFTIHLITKNYYSRETDRYPFRGGVCTTEKKEFNKMNIMPFITSKSSAKDALKALFLNTKTWSTFKTSEEVSEPMFCKLSGFIFSFLDREFDQEVAEIVYDLHVNKTSFILVTNDQEYNKNVPRLKSMETKKEEVFHGGEKAVDCVICLKELVPGKKVMRFQCSHFFHGNCIRHLFDIDQCPACWLNTCIPEP